MPAEKVNEDRLYRALNQLSPHKETLEKHLKERLGELFDLDADGLSVGSASAERTAATPCSQPRSGKALSDGEADTEKGLQFSALRLMGVWEPLRSYYAQAISSSPDAGSPPAPAWPA